MTTGRKQSTPPPDARSKPTPPPAPPQTILGFPVVTSIRVPPGDVRLVRLEVIIDPQAIRAALEDVVEP